MEKRENGLSAWQLAMMALGTVIGGSFFLGSAVAIRTAGPGIIISYLLGGAIVYVILFALSEMTVADPAPGSFRTFAQKAFGPGAGFVVGWVYWSGLVLAMSSEATAVSIILRRWLPNISLPLLGAVIIIGVSLLNLLGANQLSKLESGLAAVKLFAIIGFITLGVALIGGFMPGIEPIGLGAIANEPLFPTGIWGIAGSMLIVMFTYAGFEIIGLAASETTDPVRVVPRAITYTVFGLVGLYVVAILVLLPLVPTNVLTAEESPMALALLRWNLGWAGNAIGIVLVTAILSTMLAAMFGLGRMIRSLADEGHAPSWIKDEGNVPYRGILFSGVAMLAGLGLGFMLPQQVYLFLVSSGGFALLFSYAVIVATHHKLRRGNDCPPEGKCQLPGYPITSWLAFISILLVISSMPLVPGQGAGLLAGVLLVVLFSGIYAGQSMYQKRLAEKRPFVNRLQFEAARELGIEQEELQKAKEGKDKNDIS
ncbi:MULTISPECIES: amino acid permease [Pelosinus]|uniref:Amino acid permease-associated region n=1 Tax=Pelosinus fermentans B4 TaxID=1149862 RepID=I8REC0_9FIRM|nr:MULTISPECIES: amino acid permease [Pelosinus]EIW17728.1 amino acid permease-associated region [Pelosinus fermentans B4]EIW23689.1 amino acid permease-associated region [Pelosinus fermentans A11]OAM94614.1 amino acid permease-associated region [Pelosinus fermentans DSM 17108]SDR13620.1 amino acid transporter, AAT family [Pelosinus fermentans]